LVREGVGDGFHRWNVEKFWEEVEGGLGAMAVEILEAGVVDMWLDTMGRG
jgi:hypothetical protein